MESFGKSDDGCDKESQLETPYGDWDCDTFVASMKEEDSISLSSSSSDLEPESDIPSVVLYECTSVNVGVEEPSECIHLKENYLDQYGSYDELLKKFIENEQELRVSHYNLEHSTQEIIKLKIQIAQYEGHLDDVQKELKLKEDNLKQREGQLDDVQKELKRKEGDLEYEKAQVLEMQKQKAEMRDCCDKITKFEKMLEVVANEQLKISSNEIARLTKELESKLYETQELQGQLKVADERVAKLEREFDSGRKQIQDLKNKIQELELEVQKLSAEMVNVHEEFSLEKDKLYFDIQSLSKTNENITSRLKEWEERSNAYENKLRQLEDANLKQEKLHAAQQMALQGEMNSLKKEVGQRKHDVKAVNKEFEMHKQKFDILVNEREEADAKIGILKAEIISREDQFKKLKSKASNMLCELVLKIEALEKEITRQKDVISNQKVEKEEKIRQVEYYRTKYLQLLQESPEGKKCLFF